VNVSSGKTNSFLREPSLFGTIEIQREEVRYVDKRNIHRKDTSIIKRI